jgi:hypothetical protein
MPVWLLAECCRERREGLLWEPKGQSQKISGSSLALGMTVWGFFKHPRCFSRFSPMIRIK